MESKGDKRKDKNTRTQGGDIELTGESDASSAKELAISGQDVDFVGDFLDLAEVGGRHYVGV